MDKKCIIIGAPDAIGVTAALEIAAKEQTGGLIIVGQGNISPDLEERLKEAAATYTLKDLPDIEPTLIDRSEIYMTYEDNRHRPFYEAVLKKSKRQKKNKK